MTSAACRANCCSISTRQREPRRSRDARRDFFFSSPRRARQFLDAQPPHMFCSLSMFPPTDVPIVRLSIDESKPPRVHCEVGQQLRALRSDGVLVLGSGDIVQNLHTYAWAGQAAESFDWAARRARAIDRIRNSGKRCSPFGARTLALFLAPLCTWRLRPRKTSDVAREGMDGSSVSMPGVKVG